MLQRGVLNEWPNMWLFIFVGGPYSGPAKANFIFVTGYMDNLIAFNNRKFIDYVKDIYSSELNGGKANRLDDQANYLDSASLSGI